MENPLTKLQMEKNDDLELLELTAAAIDELTVAAAAAAAAAAVAAVELAAEEAVGKGCFGSKIPGNTKLGCCVLKSIIKALFYKPK